MKAVSILQKYIDEMAEDSKLDAFTLQDTQMKLPAIKHKWVGRCMRHKLEVAQLQEKKAALRSTLIERVIEDSPVKISKPAASSAVDNHESMVKIAEEIKQLKLVIEFLEKAERIFNSMTFDIKNLTEIMKLETQ